MFKYLLAVLLLTMTVVHAQAQPLADRVPADALVYVGWRGADDPGLGYVGSNLQAFGDETDLPEVLSQSLDLITQANDSDPSVQMAVGLIRSIGTASWHHPAAAYIRATHDPDMPIRFTVLWQVRGERAEALATSLAELTAQAPPMVPISVTHGKDVVSLAIGSPAQEIEGAAPDQALARAHHFKQALVQVDPDGGMVVYVNTQRLLSMIDGIIEVQAAPHEQQNWIKVRSALGLEGLNGVALTCGFDGPDWRSDLFIDAPAPRAGLLSLLDGSPITNEELSVVPIEATWMTAIRLDLGALMDQVRLVATEIDPEAPQRIQGFLMMVGMMKP